MIYYDTFVEHMIRHYARKPDEARTYADEANLMAVESVMNTLSEYDQSLITEIYGSGKVADNVNWISEKRNIPKEHVWMIINKTIKSVAKERGLI